MAASEYGGDTLRQHPRRVRRVLTSRQPLVEVYRRRQELRSLRALRWRQRPKAAAIEHRRRREKLYPEDMPAAAGVPGWVVRAFEEVTGTRYASRNAV